MLTIWNTRVFHGPSLWAPVPAILLEVDSGELEDRLSKQTPAFFERLATLDRRRGRTTQRAQLCRRPRLLAPSGQDRGDVRPAQMALPVALADPLRDRPEAAAPDLPPVHHDDGEDATGGA